ncbi:carbohydrate-binding module family 50 protein [Amniculicola lignicola CBS 123094]|uniref:Carbohydrate-binding module family 50 protein n=1 Tax=Amniculicola lignicola CBS 123094 TaxID=1392246 RepID=A0A6A5WH79_9PLEO|nr:carbohydrate-binding module family 50 protein [Amniculicola lignicola CBS 123094]
MKVFWINFLHLLAVISIGAHAQQFEGILRSVSYPGLSDSCLDALNTTVKGCPVLLSEASIDNPRLDSTQLAALCTASCRSALTSARSTIKAGCSAPNDTIAFDSVVYPATFIIDRFSYTYDLSCRKDASSGRYCDELMFSWLAAGNATTKAANCSDCALGSMQTQLNSPFGFDAEFAQDFQALKSTCGSSGYSFTTPAAYAVGTNLPNRAEDANTPSCSNPYVVNSGDSCDAIALARQVSTFSIIKAGGLKTDCSDLLPGVSLCLPAPCTLYRVQYGDDCKSIISAHSGVTGYGFLSWNPNITPLCTNLGDMVTNLICVSPPGGSTRDITITVTPPTTSTIESTAVPKPTNGKGDTTAPCASWYTVQDGDYCESISVRQNIALQDFYFLNPSIDKNCTNLWLDTAYCVQAVGDINTYPNYPYSSSAVYTLTSSAYVTTSSVSTSTVPSATPYVRPPHAPGTKTDCEGYVDYIPVTPFQDQSQSENVRLVTEQMNSCEFASSGYPVSYDDFLKWNPSLASIKPCYLQANYSYCAVDKISSYTGVPSYGICRSVGDPYPDTISTCECFTLITGSATKNPSCAKIASDAGIALSNLTLWNPWVGSSCDDGLYKDLALKQQRAVCIGVNSTNVSPTPTTSRITSSTPVTSSTRTTSTPVAPPSPTQSGIVKTCTKYYKAVAGDGCWAIANSNGITLDQFYAWNPAVGNDCANLWPDYAYCVAA